MHPTSLLSLFLLSCFAVSQVSALWPWEKKPVVPLHCPVNYHVTLDEETVTETINSILQTSITREVYVPIYQTVTITHEVMSVVRRMNTAPPSTIEITTTLVDTSTYVSRGYPVSTTTTTLSDTQVVHTTRTTTSFISTTTTLVPTTTSIQCDGGIQNFYHRYKDAADDLYIYNLWVFSTTSTTHARLKTLYVTSTIFDNEPAVLPDLALLNSYVAQAAQGPDGRLRPTVTKTVIYTRTICPYADAATMA